MNRPVLLLSLLLLLAAGSATAQHRMPVVDDGYAVMLPSDDPDLVMSARWYASIYVNQQSGDVVRMIGVTTDKEAATQWAINRPEIRLAKSSPSDRSEFFRESPVGAWWVRADTDGRGHITRAWGRNSCGEFWVWTGSLLFPGEEVEDGATPIVK